MKLKETYFYVKVPSLYGNQRKDGQLSRHRIGAIKAFNVDGELFVTGSLIANKEDIFKRDKAFKLIEDRMRERYKVIHVKKDEIDTLDIRDVIKKCDICLKGQDLNLLMSPLFKLRNLKDITGKIKVIQESEADCLEDNNHKLKKTLKSVLNVA